MARLTGLEPATPGVTGRYSNQLSYNRSLPSRLEARNSRRALGRAVKPGIRPPAAGRQAVRDRQIEFFRPAASRGARRRRAMPLPGPMLHRARPARSHAGRLRV